MNTRCPPKHVPSATLFFIHCRLTMQPPQSYSIGGQRSSVQLTGKPAGARPDHWGRWYMTKTLVIGARSVLTLLACSVLQEGTAVIQQPPVSHGRDTGSLRRKQDNEENKWIQDFSGLEMCKTRPAHKHTGLVTPAVGKTRPAHKHTGLVTPAVDKTRPAHKHTGLATPALAKSSNIISPARTTRPAQEHTFQCQFRQSQKFLSEHSTSWSRNGGGTF
ncbi:UNVERIFIED_CONTAM: hypothetical protein FKN15_036713 [Acipenser sinensis]